MLSTRNSYKRKRQGQIKSKLNRKGRTIQTQVKRKLEWFCECQTTQIQNNNSAMEKCRLLIMRTSSVHQSIKAIQVSMYLVTEFKNKKEK